MNNGAVEEGVPHFQRGVQMQAASKLGTYTLEVLTATGVTCVHQANKALLDQIALAAGIQEYPSPHLQILNALDRDARFQKEITHVEHHGGSRRVRSFYLRTQQREAVTTAIQLPTDPWRRRQFVGNLLELNPHLVTPTHSDAVASLLPSVMPLVAPVARERIVRLYGLDGAPPATTESLKTTHGTKLTVRSSIASSMQRLGKRIRAQLPAIMPTK